MAAALNAALAPNNSVLVMNTYVLSLPSLPEENTGVGARPESTSSL